MKNENNMKVTVICKERNFEKAYSFKPQEVADKRNRNLSFGKKFSSDFAMMQNAALMMAFDKDGLKCSGALIEFKEVN